MPFGLNSENMSLMAQKVPISLVVVSLGQKHFVGNCVKKKCSENSYKACTGMQEQI